MKRNEKEAEKLKIDEEKFHFTARTCYKFLINKNMTLYYEIQIVEKV